MRKNTREFMVVGNIPEATNTNLWEPSLKGVQKLHYINTELNYILDWLQYRLIYSIIVI